MLQVTTKSLPVRSQAIPAVRWLDALAAGVIALTAVVAAATFRDYGLGWDDYTHSQYGKLLVSLYGSGFADKRALSFVNLYMYGGGFDILATLAAKVLPFALNEKWFKPSLLPSVLQHEGFTGKQIAEKILGYNTRIVQPEISIPQFSE